jgi:hypothetical protein
MPAPVALFHMIISYMLSQSLYVAARLGIADLLQNGPQSSDALATAVGAHPDALYRVLRALASVGIFAEVEHRQFTLTPLARFLQTNVPGSLRALAIHFGEEGHWRSWGELLYSVKTGKSAFEHVFGMGLFDWMAQHAEARDIFNAAMTASTMQESLAVVAAYDFSGVRTIVDVGGGHGALIAACLQAYPQLHGILFDLPHVIAGARDFLESESVGERCEPVAGDFFASVPAGGDAYLLRWILHDWDDARAVTILHNCHRAMQEQGKLLVIETLIAAGNAPSIAKLSDLEMLVRAGGRERTEAEYRALFAAAGFRLTRVIPTQSLIRQSSVIEGVRV